MKSKITRREIKIILTAIRDDEKGECNTIRKWLNKRNIYNDNLRGPDRLIEEMCKYLIEN